MYDDRIIYLVKTTRNCIVSILNRRNESFDDIKSKIEQEIRHLETESGRVVYSYDIPFEKAVDRNYIFSVEDVKFKFVAINTIAGAYVKGTIDID